MSIENNLYKAYVHIADGDLQSAADFLELLVSDNPLNVEAWEAYMQICTTREELDLLCERALQVSTLNQTDRESVLDYYYFLRQRLMYGNVNVELQNSITLELVDQFTFTLQDQPDKESRYGLNWILEKAIIILYVVLMVLGVNLLSIKNNFGYWLLIVPAVNIYVNTWKIESHIDKSQCKMSAHQIFYLEKRTGEIDFFPEMLR